MKELTKKSLNIGITLLIFAYLTAGFTDYNTEYELSKTYKEEIKEERDQYVKNLPKDIKKILSNYQFTINRAIEKNNLNLNHNKLAGLMLEIYIAELAKDMKVEGDTDLFDNESKDKIKKSFLDAIKIIESNTYNGTFDYVKVEKQFKEKLKSNLVDFNFNDDMDRNKIASKFLDFFTGMFFTILLILVPNKK